MKKRNYLAAIFCSFGFIAPAFAQDIPAVEPLDIETPECGDEVLLRQVEGNYRITNGPAMVHMPGRTIASPAAIAFGPATLSVSGAMVSFDSPIFGNLSLDLHIVELEDGEMNFIEWDFEGNESDFSPLSGEDLGIAMGCDEAFGTIRLHGEGTVDLPNVGTVPINIWLEALLPGLLHGRMDAVMVPGTLLQSNIMLERIGALDYETVDEQVENLSNN